MDRGFRAKVPEVFGLEVQGDWVDPARISLAFSTFTNRSRIDDLGLFTGRVGLLH